MHADTDASTPSKQGGRFWMAEAGWKMGEGKSKKVLLCL